MTRYINYAAIAMITIFLGVLHTAMEPFSAAETARLIVPHGAQSRVRPVYMGMP